MSGVAYSFFTGFDGLGGVISPAVLVGMLFIVASAVTSSQKAQAERVAMMADLEKRCDVIGRRDPQSIFDYAQIGYRCPGSDGKGTVEQWVNSQ
jgi:hypothetical protein